MTSFKSLFGRFFVEKAKNVYSFLIIQTVGALAFSVFGLLIGTGKISEFLNSYTELLPDWLMGFCLLGVFFVIFFFIYIIVKNEKINHNQTWRLTAISDEKFYIANSLSTFATFVYFIILNIIVAGILLTASFFMDKDFRNSCERMFKQFRPNFEPNTIRFIFDIMLLLLLCCFFISLLISFLNFSSKAIMDYLPVASSGLIVKLLHIFIVIVIALLFTKAEKFFVDQVLGSLLNFLNFNPAYNNALPYVNVIVVVVNLIMYVINIFLFKYFFEAEEKK
ncbi:hypothetical protein JF76_10050 [Lactobacillus kullabergensis]|uniref:ABC transporter permease n=1 Tax=Lactobacillus kullabergensis TaxID=1218493 RepID=A0A0F4L9S0_9LACO|nr:hypothetical protein [Lactobacillus kullabergensis]AWM75346.1 hypothetical protein DKL58_04880 [Lactobacillus kullabergensis]KJY55370.1 hypothetical protein JF76_10050 [Lactobacillus kullabergensis]